MKRFLERIDAKSRAPGQPPVMIVAFGDSVTQGAMEHGRFDPEGVYHHRFQRRLEGLYPLASFSTINAGVSGDRVTRALGRLERDVLRRRPDLALIAFGLNDALDGLSGVEAFRDALREKILRIRKETEADVVLLTPPVMARRRSVRIHPDHEAFANGILQAQNEGVLARYAEAIHEAATVTAVPLADIHCHWELLEVQGIDPDTWLCNGLNHPDERGHRLAADLLWQTATQFSRLLL